MIGPVLADPKASERISNASRPWGPQALGKCMQYMIADRGDDGLLVKPSMIPRRQGALSPGLRSEDQSLYRTRVAIEHCFDRLKENKRLALRFDPLDIPFFSFFALAYLTVFR